MLPAIAERAAPAELVRAWRRAGQLSDQSLGGLPTLAAAQWPRRPAIVDVTDGGQTLAYAQLLSEIRRLAGFLRGRGVRAGDVILIQAPNCWEVSVAWWTGWHLGCVVVPVVDIYRSHELRQIARAVRPEVLVSVTTFRDHDHAATLDQVVDELGIAPRVRLAIRGQAAGWTEFHEALAAPDGPAGDAGPADPGAAALVLFTSGTTAEAKGVVHSSRSIIAEGRQMQHAFGIDWRDRCYMSLPLSHVTGLDLGVIVPMLTGSSVILARMARLGDASAELLRHRATWTSGPPSQVPDIAACHRASNATELPLRIFATGGTTVHRAQLEHGEELGFHAMRCYGMTELPTVTMPSGADDAEIRLATDGPIAAGCACEAVDPATRRPLPPGEEGELRVRGPERMLAYVDPDSTRRQLDDQGWFYSGDLGVVDDGRYVRVTGRLKDIINRGGEKFSAREIEEVILRHRDVAEVAVVAAPDRRFGEVPAAFLVAAPGSAPVPDDRLVSLLVEQGVARQKTPTHWRWVDQLPMTASGKVKKYELAAGLDPIELESGPRAGGRP
jgi:acyl-CoA synthetase (AMP-forming)/AMP-acid ligase II